MQRWTIYDRYGNQLYLTEERWRHALEKRPWLGDLFDDVFDAVRRGRRQQDPLNPRKYKYYLRCPKLLPEFNHIVVVVLFAEHTGEADRRIPNNYVVNVWAVFFYGKG